MLRFSIRDVLWLTVVVAMGVGWLLTAQRAALLTARLRGIEVEHDVLAHHLAGVQRHEVEVAAVVDRGDPIPTVPIKADSACGARTAPIR